MTDCHVAIDSAGDAVAVWSYETEFEFQPVWAAYRPAGGGWQAPVELAPPQNPESAPDVAIDPRGDAQAVWIGSSFAIQGVYKPAGQDWQQPKSVTEAESLSEKEHSASDPHVAFDSRGDAITAWDIDAGEHEVVQASSRSDGGAWQTPVNLSAAGQNAYVPSVAMDSAAKTPADTNGSPGPSRTATSALTVQRQSSKRQAERASHASKTPMPANTQGRRRHPCRLPSADAKPPAA